LKGSPVSGMEHLDFGFQLFNGCHKWWFWNILASPLYNVVHNSFLKPLTLLWEVEIPLLCFASGITCLPHMLPMVEFGSSWFGFQQVWKKMSEYLQHDFVASPMPLLQSAPPRKRYLCLSLYLHQSRLQADT
jgi:hypothetical protein